jgi:hypothetical protein
MAKWESAPFRSQVLNLCTEMKRFQYFCVVVCSGGFFRERCENVLTRVGAHTSPRTSLWSATELDRAVTAAPNKRQASDHGQPPLLLRTRTLLNTARFSTTTFSPRSSRSRMKSTVLSSALLLLLGTCLQNRVRLSVFTGFRTCGILRMLLKSMAPVDSEARHVFRAVRLTSTCGGHLRPFAPQAAYMCIWSASAVMIS